MKSLVFAYNADDGLFSMVSDYIHKIVSPSTYACNLCKITYSKSGGMNRQWKKYIEGLTIDIEFVHRNELADKYEITEVPLPAVYLKDGDYLSLLIETEAIDACKSVSELIKIVNEKIKLNF